MVAVSSAIFGVVRNSIKNNAKLAGKPVHATKNRTSFMASALHRTEQDRRNRSVGEYASDNGGMDPEDVLSQIASLE